MLSQPLQHSHWLHIQHLLNLTPVYNCISCPTKFQEMLFCFFLSEGALLPPMGGYVYLMLIDKR